MVEGGLGCVCSGLVVVFVVLVLVGFGVFWW